MTRSITIWDGDDCPLGWGLFDNDDDDDVIFYVQRDDLSRRFETEDDAQDAANPILRTIIDAAVFGAKCMNSMACQHCGDLGFVRVVSAKRGLHVAYCRCVRESLQDELAKSRAHRLLLPALQTLTKELE